MQVFNELVDVFLAYKREKRSVDAWLFGYMFVHYIFEEDYLPDQRNAKEKPLKLTQRRSDATTL